MSRAVWTLIYDINNTNRSRYLEWFHHIHMGDKLSRPGYQWASHYEVITSESDTDCESSCFIALFGGYNTATFLNPSPRQLKRHQDAKTRDMMEARSNSSALILNHEWSIDGQNHEDSFSTAIDCPELTVGLFDAPGHNEILGAWCIQELAPQSNTHLRMSKLSNIAEGFRHAIIIERDSATLPTASFDGELGTLLSSILKSRQLHAKLLHHIKEV